MSDDRISRLRDQIWQFYASNKRSMPWREFIHPYHVVVSEVMLQQTQVARVLAKFPEFIRQFPDFSTLAQSRFDEVLSVWKGMGYNRRARYLQTIAHIILETYNGIVPSDPVLVDKLPGIGWATACSIVTFSYNIPTVFIETNIRRVFIHSFFQDRSRVDDREIIPYLEKMVPQDNPREWYYAVMDYGTYLAKQIENPNRKSKHYTKQSSFAGSNRQIRGQILAVLLKKTVERSMLYDALEFEPAQIDRALDELVKEGLVQKHDTQFSIS